MRPAKGATFARLVAQVRAKLDKDGDRISDRRFHFCDLLVRVRAHARQFCRSYVNSACHIAAEYSLPLSASTDNCKNIISTFNSPTLLKKPPDSGSFG
jgi:hypothetical protein